jgi:hypothetical protein
MFIGDDGFNGKDYPTLDKIDDLYMSLRGDKIKKYIVSHAKSLLEVANILIAIPISIASLAIAFQNADIKKLVASQETQLKRLSDIYEQNVWVVRRLDSLNKTAQENNKNAQKNMQQVDKQTNLIDRNSKPRLHISNMNTSNYAHKGYDLVIDIKNSGGRPANNFLISELLLVKEINGFKVIKKKTSEEFRQKTLFPNEFLYLTTNIPNSLISIGEFRNCYIVIEYSYSDGETDKSYSDIEIRKNYSKQNLGNLNFGSTSEDDNELIKSIVKKMKHTKDYYFEETK